ncbi:putative tetratricopeptide-like helical domain superfamily [Helianthus annuus]|nr:putative tetratricopeptide-like helical domain superfamily [Helianthus annuus]
MCHPAYRYDQGVLSITLSTVIFAFLVLNMSLDLFVRCRSDSRRCIVRFVQLICNRIVEIGVRSYVRFSLNMELKSVVALLKGFCMKGLMNEADKVFDKMLQRKQAPTEAVYNVLIHGHCKGGPRELEEIF